MHQYNTDKMKINNFKKIYRSKEKSKKQKQYNKLNDMKLYINLERVRKSVRNAEKHETNNVIA